MVLAGSLTLATTGRSQHLWWNLEQQRDATCLYGEITVLATHPGVYYCGANWHPGQPAGGYCGIQDIAPTERWNIFSIWDTTPTLRPTITPTDSQTVIRRFGGEGEGAHTHMKWDWKLGETFQFFVQKLPGRTADTTDARFYIFDRALKQWRHSATITSPNGGHGSVATIGGGLNSFLENFTGRDPGVVKLALYRLWLGPSVDTMKCLTRAVGDGVWGKLNDAYFLASGNATELKALFEKLEPQYGKPVYGTHKAALTPIPAAPLPVEAMQVKAKST